MDIRSISFDDLNSWDDFKLMIESAEIGYPRKNKTTIQVPNSNIKYDYAAIFGDLYEERTLEYSFYIVRPNALSIEELEHKKAQVANWLQPGIKHKLSDTAIPNYYFIAEAQGDYDYTEENGYSIFKVKFVCYPFKIHAIPEGADVWDIFEFDNDIAQEIKFDVDGSIAANIYNIGLTAVNPRINVAGTVTISANNISETFSQGSYTDTKIVLKKGVNSVVITGKGSVQFIFSKEVL